MWRLSAKYFSKLLLIAAPISLPLIGWFDLAKEVDSDKFEVDLIVLSLTGSRGEVELQFRVIVTAVALLLVFSVDLFDLYFPRLRLQEFQKHYLKAQKERWIGELGDDVRICIMHAYRPWWFPFVRKLRWVWDHGFEPPRPHRDLGLGLWEFQGVAGRALRQRDFFLADFRSRPLATLTAGERWPPFNEFRLWPWQLKKCLELKAILGVPLLRQKVIKGQSKPWKAVGVICLDSNTEDGAQLIVENKVKLIEYFTDDGKILAWLK